MICLFPKIIVPLLFFPTCFHLSFMVACLSHLFRVLVSVQSETSWPRTFEIQRLCTKGVLSVTTNVGSLREAISCILWFRQSYSCSRYVIFLFPPTLISGDGKSGAFFIFTKDHSFVLKTATGDERDFLWRMLPEYYLVFPLSLPLPPTSSSYSPPVHEAQPQFSPSPILWCLFDEAWRHWWNDAICCHEWHLPDILQTYVDFWLEGLFSFFFVMLFLFWWFSWLIERDPPSVGMSRKKRENQVVYWKIWILRRWASSCILTRLPKICWWSSSRRTVMYFISPTLLDSMC